MKRAEAVRFIAGKSIANAQGWLDDRASRQTFAHHAQAHRLELYDAIAGVRPRPLELALAALLASSEAAAVAGGRPALWNAVLYVQVELVRNLSRQANKV